MNKPTTPTFNPELRLEPAQLVVDQGHTIRDAAEAMSVSQSILNKWMRQLPD